MDKKKPNISVLVASYNHRDGLELCLDSLDKQTLPRDQYEVVVVLDGSTDGSRQMLDKKKYTFHLNIIEQRNKGKAIALNHAASSSNGTLLVIIDSDVVVDESFLEVHLKAHERAEVVVGPIPLSDKSPVNFLSDGVREWAEDYDHRIREMGGPQKCVDIFGANLSISRMNFDKIGGYREDLIRSQDLHFGKKILDAKLSVLFSPEAIAYQYYDKTIPRFFKDWYLFGKSHVLFIQEYPEEAKNLRLSRYRDLTWAKWIATLILRYRNPVGDVILGITERMLERYRRRGSRSKLLASIKGVIAHALYWRGVFDESGKGLSFWKKL